MIRTLAFAVTLSLPLLAHAQSTIMPNGAGGYTILTPGQPSTFITPNGAGGYFVNNPQSQRPTYPDYLGFTNQITHQWNPQRFQPQR